MPDRVRVEISVSKGPVSTRTALTRPMNWSGDPRRHRKQIAEVATEITDVIVAQLKLAESGD